MSFQKMPAQEGFADIVPIYDFKATPVFEGRFISCENVKIKEKNKIFLKFRCSTNNVEYLLNPHYVIDELVNKERSLSDPDSGEIYTNFCLANYNRTHVRLVYLGNGKTKNGNPLAKFQIEIDFSTIEKTVETKEKTAVEKMFERENEKAKAKAKEKE